MRKPRFDNRVFDTVMCDNGGWLIVFSSAYHRVRHKDFKQLPVTTCQRPRDAYVATRDFIASMGFRKAISVRLRSSKPRVSDQIFIDGDDVLRGYITSVLYDRGICIVKFDDNTIKEFEFSVLEGQWTDKFGGIFYIEGDDGC